MLCLFVFALSSGHATRREETRRRARESYSYRERIGDGANTRVESVGRPLIAYWKKKTKKDAAHTKRAVVHRAIQQRFWPSVRFIRVRLGSVDTLVEVETVPPVATVQPPAAKETANKVC